MGQTFVPGFFAFCARFIYGKEVIPPPNQKPPTSEETEPKARVLRPIKTERRMP